MRFSRVQDEGLAQVAEALLKEGLGDLRPRTSRGRRLAGIATTRMLLASDTVEGDAPQKCIHCNVGEVDLETEKCRSCGRRND